MHIVIAPDSYKGSLCAIEVAEAMKTGALRVFPNAVMDLVPIADGGEGTVDALVRATDGAIRQSVVKGPLGVCVTARWGLFGDGETAIIEMAAASGLPLILPNKRDAMNACSYGTGELVRAALDAGAKTIILGIGGSATNDGGAGFARALGAKFLDPSGHELPPGGAALQHLASIDLSGMDPRLTQTTFRVACDVENPLCGKRGASAVFGPQKGAKPAQVTVLDAALAKYATIATRHTGKTNVADTPGAGAAGGLGAGLLFFTNATLMPGVTLVLDAVRFDERVRKADFVITGEGRTDFQTAFGKAPVGVAKAAKKYGLPVLCLAGGLGEGANDVYAHGVDVVCSIAPGPISLEECLNNSVALIEDATERLCRLMRAGSVLKKANEKTAC